jgi:predicted transposase YbfD/YdcC
MVNQPTLHDDVQRVFLEALENDFGGLAHRYHHTKEEAHGRTEERHYHVIEVPEALARKHAGFAGLRTLGMVFSQRQVGDGPEGVETRFYISSMGLKVRAFAEAVRGHWSIENNLHWVLDVAFHEDASRLRKDHGPENLGLVRRIALSLLKRTKTKRKVGIACKRKQAGWNNDFLVSVLLGSHG